MMKDSTSLGRGRRKRWSNRRQTWGTGLDRAGSALERYEI